jgi:glycosyl hydrolase family 77 (putative 4-alpha-glucanotransferase)/phosphoglucomutase/phosphomannomutase-like protein
VSTQPNRSISLLAGKPAPRELLIDPARLEREYYERRPDPSDPEQLVRFGTSGHRGSSFRGSFNETHILAITQAICDYRAAHGTDGPLYMGMDTHAISPAAQRTALEVLAANGVETIIQQNNAVTPTPVIQAARSELGDLPLIAEDLGLITSDVIQLRDSQSLPGMRVLQFAFDGNPQNPHLPQNYVPNTVAYTGTHDNNTTRGWFEVLPDQQKQALSAYLRRATVENREAAPELMRLAWSSSAALAIAPLQDLLNLGPTARMNTPGEAAGNWRWRITDGALSPVVFDRLRDMTSETRRCPADCARAKSAALEEIEVTR